MIAPNQKIPNPIIQTEKRIEIVESNMAAISDLIFRVAPLQIKPRLLITFLVQIMQQRRVGVARQLFRQFVNARKDRQQVRLWIRRRH